VTSEGLRIELIEGKDGTFYQSGSAQLSDNGQELMTLLAGELKTIPNDLLIEGHTDATPYSTDNTYSNWELSADRANSARRLLQDHGVRADQVTQVRGYADQMLRVKNDPYDPSNRRISILVKNGDDDAPPPQISAGRVVNADAAPPAATPKATVAGAKPPVETKPPENSKAEATPAAPDPQPQAPAKPAVGTASAKPGLLDRLKSMLPGSKK
jgi:chemotaxis protein MotB